MAMTFPSSPTNGQVFSAPNGSSYTYNSTTGAWVNNNSRSAGVRQYFTATASQTIFTITNGYSIGLIDVYRNGVKLNPNGDFTATDGSIVSLTTPANLNDDIEVIGLSQFSQANMLPLTGGTITGTLINSAGNITVSANSCNLYLNKTIATSSSANNIWGQTSGSNRWVVVLGSATTEPGSNVGSDFSILRYDDTGANLSVPLTITRSTGLVSANNGLAVTGGTTTDSMNGGSLAGFRNRIINGDFTFNQRGASTTTANVFAMGLDRWNTYPTGAAVTIGSSNTGGSLPGVAGGYFNEITISGAAGNTGVQLAQRIESANISDLAGKPITISFWLYCSNAVSANVVTVSLNYPSSKDNYSTTVNIATYPVSQSAIIAGSWVYCTSTISSLSSTVTAGLQMNILLPALTSGSYAVTGVQLESGTVATPFERRPIGTELALCQRYFEKSYDLATAPGAVDARGSDFFYVQNLSSGTLTGGKGLSYKVPKMIIPTMTTYSPTTGASGKIRDANNSADVTANVQNSGLNGFSWFASTSAATTVLNMQIHWTASAEL